MRMIVFCAVADTPEIYERIREALNHVGVAMQLQFQNQATAVLEEYEADDKNAVVTRHSQAKRLTHGKSFHNPLPLDRRPE
jgi:hypothetical protein